VRRGLSREDRTTPSLEVVDSEAQAEASVTSSLKPDALTVKDGIGIVVGSSVNMDTVEEARNLYLKLAAMVTQSLRDTGDVDDKLYRVCSKARRRMTSRLAKYFEEHDKMPWKGEEYGV